MPLQTGMPDEDQEDHARRVIMDTGSLARPRPTAAAPLPAAPPSAACTPPPAAPPTVVNLQQASTGRGPSSSSAGSGGASRQRGTVLVVDDMAINRVVLGHMVRKAGLDVVEASNGAEAMEQVVTHPPGHFQCILMDLQMPVVDGWQATQQIRAWEAGYSRADSAGPTVLGAPVSGSPPCRMQTYMTDDVATGTAGHLALSRSGTGVTEDTQVVGGPNRTQYGGMYGPPSRSSTLMLDTTDHMPRILRSPGGAAGGVVGADCGIARSSTCATEDDYQPGLFLGFDRMSSFGLDRRSTYGYERFPTQGTERLPSQNLDRFPSHGTERQVSQSLDRFPSRGTEGPESQSLEYFPSHGTEQLPSPAAAAIGGPHALPAYSECARQQVGGGHGSNSSGSNMQQTLAASSANITSWIAARATTHQQQQQCQEQPMWQASSLPDNALAAAVQQQLQSLHLRSSSSSSRAVPSSPASGAGSAVQHQQQQQQQQRREGPWYGSAVVAASTTGWPGHTTTTLSPVCARSGGNTTATAVSGSSCSNSGAAPGIGPHVLAALAVPGVAARVPLGCAAVATELGLLATQRQVDPGPSCIGGGGGVHQGPLIPGPSYGGASQLWRQQVLHLAPARLPSQVLEEGLGSGTGSPSLRLDGANSTPSRSATPSLSPHPFMLTRVGSSVQQLQLLPIAAGSGGSQRNSFSASARPMLPPEHAQDDDDDLCTFLDDDSSQPFLLHSLRPSAPELLSEGQSGTTGDTQSGGSGGVGFREVSNVNLAATLSLLNPSLLEADSRGSSIRRSVSPAGSQGSGGLQASGVAGSTAARGGGVQASGTAAASRRHGPAADAGSTLAQAQQAYGQATAQHPAAACDGMTQEAAYTAAQASDGDLPRLSAVQQQQWRLQQHSPPQPSSGPVAIVAGPSGRLLRAATSSCDVCRVPVVVASAPGSSGLPLAARYSPATATAAWLQPGQQPAVQQRNVPYTHPWAAGPTSSTSQAYHSGRPRGNSYDAGYATTWGRSQSCMLEGGHPSNLPALHVPIVACTAEALASPPINCRSYMDAGGVPGSPPVTAAEHALSCGVDECVRKPLSFQELSRILRKYIPDWALQNVQELGATSNAAAPSSRSAPMIAVTTPPAALLQGQGLGPATAPGSTTALATQQQQQQ